MAEYIERVAAVKVVLRERKPTNSVAQNRMLSIIQRDLLTMRAADVAPVVHGRWEMRPTGMATDTGPEYKAYCTACNEPNKQYHPPFCPHCGAKMDGGGSDAAD
nr:MAG TPA: zinc-ribbon containing domain protein [Caudoviricetes sp.]